MKKLSLKIDDIAVTSFETDEYEDVRGTVAANGAITVVHCAGTVKFAGDDDECTSGCVCCRFRPAPKPV
jgi:hypothetical protein